MANPYLVIGGIAVGIATAGFGLLQVPGWVESAQDAAAINDLANVAIGEAVGSTMGPGYLNGGELAADRERLGLSFTLSNGVQLCVTRSDDRTAYAAVALSQSGTYLARTAEKSETGKGDTATAALAQVGGLPEGVPAPSVDGDCAPGAEIPTGAFPGTGPGTGPGPGAGNPGGPGVGDLDPDAPASAPLLMGPWALDWTPQGLVAVAFNPDGASNYHLVRISNGTVEKLVKSGPAATASFTEVAAARDGTVYALARNDDWTTTTLYSVTPDGRSEVLLTASQDELFRINTAPNGDLYYMTGFGTFMKHTGGGNFEHAGTGQYDAAYGGLELFAVDASGTITYVTNIMSSAPGDQEVTVKQLTAGGAHSQIALDGFAWEYHSRPSDLILAPNGDMYFISSDYISRVSPTGAVTANLEGAPVDSRGMAGLAIDPQGNIFVSDAGWNTVSVFNPDTNKFTVLVRGPGWPEE